MLQCYQCNGQAVLHEKGEGRTFCSADHHELYHVGWSALLDTINTQPSLRHRVIQHLGMKRAKEEEEEIIVTLEELEFLPDDVMGEILRFAYHEVGVGAQKTGDAAKARRASKRMRELVDKYLFLPVKELGGDVLYNIDDEGLSLFKGLEKLCLSWYTCSKLTEQGVAKMVQLKDLSISTTHIPWTGECFQRMTSLTKLEIGGHYGDAKELLFMDGCFKPLVSLEELVLEGYNGVEDFQIEALPHLKRLTLRRNGLISGKCFLALTQLETLIIEKPYKVMEAEVFRSLSLSLTRLELKGASGITDEVLAGMASLRVLKLKKGKTGISDVGLMGLTKLRNLTLTNVPNITNKGLSLMSCLGALHLFHNQTITLDGLLPFKETLSVITLFRSLIHFNTLSGFAKLRYVSHEYDREEAFASFVGKEKIRFTWINPPWARYQMK